jgi:hypothetical protein
MITPFPKTCCAFSPTTPLALSRGLGLGDRRRIRIRHRFKSRVRVNMLVVVNMCESLTSCQLPFADLSEQTFEQTPKWRI